MADEKKWYKSKTLWVAILTIAMGVAEFVQGQMSSGATLSVIGIVNVFLRLVTAQTVKL